MTKRDPRPSVGRLLRDPTVRGPVKTVLRAWADRDPLDAAHDAGLIALALERAADEALTRGARLAVRARGGACSS
jgi:hypothetical protein